MEREEQGPLNLEKPLCSTHKNHIYGRGEAYTVILHDGLSLPRQPLSLSVHPLCLPLSSRKKKKKASVAAAGFFRAGCMTTAPHLRARTHAYAGPGLTRLDTPGLACPGRAGICLHLHHNNSVFNK